MSEVQTPPLTAGQKAALTKRLKRLHAEQAAAPHHHPPEQSSDAPGALSSPPAELPPPPAPAARPKSPPRARASAPTAQPAREPARVVELHADRLAFVSSAGDLVAMLRAALMFVSKDVKRPELRMVRFESDGVTLRVVSSNGHCIYDGEMPARQSELTRGSFDLHVDAAVLLYNTIRKWKKDSQVLLNAELATVSRVSNPKDYILLHRADVPFPKWRNSVAGLEPGEPDGNRIGVAGKYLASACAALNATEVLVWTTHNSDTSPMSLSGQTIAEHPATVIIAPCRT